MVWQNTFSRYWTILSSMGKLRYIGPVYNLPFNTVWHEGNGQYFAAIQIRKRIFVFWLKFNWNFFLMVHLTAVVQVMARCLTGDMHYLKQGSFCVFAQPMRDVTMWRHLSLAGCIHKMIPAESILTWLCESMWCMVYCWVRKIITFVWYGCQFFLPLQLLTKLMRPYVNDNLFS